MKRGQSYITLTDDNKHVLIDALKKKGINKIELIYTPSFGTQCGWDLVNSDKTTIGWDGWLGYTKKEALKLIERIEVRDEHFIYLNERP